MDDNEKDRISRKIDELFGPGRPWVLVYDDTSLEDSLDVDAGTTIATLTARNQPTYVSDGLLRLAEFVYATPED